MAEADSDSAPLLGTAMRSFGQAPSMASTRLSQVRVHVVQRQAAGEHEDLQVVQQLADLLGGALRSLVLGGHPHLAGLLDHLLAARVDASVELGHGARALGTTHRRVRQLGEQRVEGLHGRPPYGARTSVPLSGLLQPCAAIPPRARRRPPPAAPPRPRPTPSPPRAPCPPPTRAALPGRAPAARRRT